MNKVKTVKRTLALIACPHDLIKLPQMPSALTFTITFKRCCFFCPLFFYSPNWISIWQAMKTGSRVSGQRFAWAVTGALAHRLSTSSNKPNLCKESAAAMTETISLSVNHLPTGRITTVALQRLVHHLHHKAVTTLCPSCVWPLVV